MLLKTKNNYYSLITLNYYGRNNQTKTCSINRIISDLNDTICCNIGYLIYISKYAIWGFTTQENAQKFFYFQHDMVDLFVNGVLAMGILYAINAIGTFLIKV